MNQIKVHNQNKITENIVYSVNNSYVTNTTQRPTIEFNINNQVSAIEENEENSEQVTNEMISDN
ncbi:14962_t:CDS:1, partial [Cetraspora pellucida]